MVSVLEFWAEPSRRFFEAVGIAGQPEPERGTDFCSALSPARRGAELPAAGLSDRQSSPAARLEALENAEKFFYLPCFLWLTNKISAVT